MAPRGFHYVAPTEAERYDAPAYARRRRRLECDTCGGRIWGSGLGIGSHRRSKAHERAYWLAEAEHYDRKAADATVATDADWYRAEAARLRALA